MSPLRGKFLLVPTALVALAAAPFVASPWAPLLGVLGLALGAGRQRRMPPRERRLAGAFLVLSVALLGVEAGVRALPRPSLEATTAALDSGLTSYWNDLVADTRRIAGVFADRTAELGDRRADFERLAAAGERAPRLTFLLFDADGELAAWTGPGLLQRVDSALLGARTQGYLQGATSATLYVSSSIPGPGHRPWTLVAGESFRREAAPPGVRPGQARAVRRWRLEPGDGGHLRLRVESFAAAGRSVEPQALRRAATASAAIGFALLAVFRGSSLLLLTGAAAVGGRPRLEWIISTAAAALALGASAAGAHLPEALAVAAGCIAAGLGWRFGGRDGATAWRALPAAAAGPILLVVAAAMPERSEAIRWSLFGDADEIALRLAVSALLAGALFFGRRRLEARHAPRAVWLGALAGLAAAACVDHPVAVAIAAATSGLLVARSLPSRALDAPGRIAGAALLAMLLGGAAWSSGAALGHLRGVEARLPTLLPPTSSELDRLDARLQSELATVAPPLLEEDGEGATLPSDMALAIWSRSGLARRDALSALALVRDDGERAGFSYGLPLDAQGAPDLGPARWVDLDPPAWIERRRVEAQEIELADGRRFQIRWALVPRPGFGPGAPRVSDLPAALLRGGAAQKGLSELVPGAHAAIYDTGGQPVVSPWIDGTPRLDPVWADGRPFSRSVRTPDGMARVAAIRGDGVAAALFVQEESWAGSLDRVGTFAAGALLVGLVLALVALAVVLPRGAVRDLVRRSMRSYSKRLVVVFSVLLLAPLLLVYALFAHTLSQRLAEQQETAAFDAMRSAQRVLGEYVLSLEPGFGVGTALDDRLFEWLARVVHHEINLYWGSDIYASSKRELFTAGLLPRRIPGSIWERIALAGERVAQRDARTGHAEYLELYAPLEVPGVVSQAPRLILALPLLAQQEELDAEADAVRRRALLVTLALSVLLAALGSRFAARFTRPIEAIVAGTRRIAAGAPALDFRPDEVELEALTDAIDRMAGRIAESRERLLGEKRLVERIVDNVTAAVVGLDRDGRVLLANRLAREWLGVSPGTALADSLAERGLEGVAAALAAARGAAEPVSTRVRSGKLARDWALVRVPIEGGEPAELVVVEDVTDVVRAQRLDAWLAMARIIAHEIKNPLTPIRLSTEHLREAWSRDRSHFEAVFDRCTDNILAQVEELRRTASEFSLYSEIPRIERRPGDLRPIVAEIVGAYRAAPPAGVKLVYEPPARAVEASFDARLLGRALRNLVENALRASAGGGRVEVRLERSDGTAVLRVLDEGPGVPAAQLDRVLEPYFSTAAGGTGLGLPIARRVAEEHGGSLEVRNREGKGFEVAITIPSR